VIQRLSRRHCSTATKIAERRRSARWSPRAADDHLGISVGRGAR
jgi:hypothetical protein